MKITVLGCGALGQLWLSALIKAGHEVQGWLKVHQSYLGIAVLTPEQNLYSHDVITNSPQQLTQCELLLVTLKAQQIETALVPLLPYLPASCPIILLHNGLGVVDDLPAVTHPLCHAVTTQAAYRTATQTCHKAWGITQLGPLNDAARSISHIADILHHALPDVAWYNDIKVAAWKKLAVNAVINPLTVKYECHNGQLMEHLNEVSILCRELVSIMNREGIHTEYEPLYHSVITVIQNTSQNMSSMLQDVRAQRLTEIDYINGYLLKRARGYGLTAPHHHALYQWIKTKESAYAPISLSPALPRSWQ
ncbi:2-dehydropantoate 2-reductase [Rosenbergiella australiborealis]|uniref:2-dehydropantoate 2-reductase n=1 Tax=Rosenbergiella australiborealis TaxID=1544696 RepID=UPI001F4EFA60|nr:2-dehydropantoate 2-reductase [Rosenbergiella australiborealis]